MPSAVLGKSRFGIYDLGDGRHLFVPNEEMWALHEASKPAAVADRSGLGKTTYRQWVDRFGPWIINWLYTSPSLPPSESNGFEPTPEMLAFRKQATKQAIREAAPRSKESVESAWRQDRGVHVNDSLVSYWRRNDFKSHLWFDHFLFRGQVPPPNITVATVQQVRRCSIAWDVLAIRNRADISSETYVRWLRLRLVPTLDWLKWLFGAPPPAGSFVVGIPLQNLRREMGQEAIIGHLGISDQTVWKWKNGKRTAAPFQAILDGGDPAGAEGWSSLTEETKQNMRDYRNAASLLACLGRADISRAAYYKARHEADACGVLDNLDRYIRMEAPYDDRPRSGLAVPNFFIPTPDMLRFREAASKQRAGQTIWANQDLPGFDDWFLDWTVPKPHHGRRIPVRRSASAPPYANGTDDILDPKQPADKTTTAAAPHRPPAQVVDPGLNGQAAGVGIPPAPLKDAAGSPGQGKRGPGQPAKLSRADLDLADEWKRAHECGILLKDFARDNGMTQKKLKRILSRVRMNRLRSERKLR
jgi:hypothetical protein